ncbi:hypothetical protein BDW74DRAFT_91570 [Aspergillus multicolor]|uniref:uncharacterized protein n=1 Tax=Aspergillus multicolor TaxID=41759 RepID=UPI003CCE49C3
MTGGSAALPPAYIVHIDDSPNEAKARAVALLGNEEYHQCFRNGRRIRIINAWKPIVNTVEIAPLAICDRRTVAEADIVTYDKVHPDRVREGAFAFHNPGQKWFYLPEQREDEVALFTIWDSDMERGPSGCPHSSLSSENDDSGSVRESIELLYLRIGPWHIQWLIKVTSCIQKLDRQLGDH